MLETAQGSGEQSSRRQQYERERCLENDECFTGQCAGSTRRAVCATKRVGGIHVRCHPRCSDSESDTSYERNSESEEQNWYGWRGVDRHGGHRFESKVQNQ